MKNYDDIVVGSGISGLTMALIMGMNGRKVLLLEKSPRIGGSVSRFYKRGVPFDTGFHFTGGLDRSGILHDILSVLGIRDLIQPIFLSEDKAHCFFFESENRLYEIPYGIENIKKKFKGYFPGEGPSIDRYFDKVRHVCAHTPSMDLRVLGDSLQHHLEEDFLSLEEVLNGLTGNAVLKALLSGFAMCYGVMPKEISFANHSRMSLNLYESVARIKDGGDALIRAFETKFKNCDIEIQCNKYIADLEDIKNKRVGRFILNTGEEISALNCIFTIHPKEVLKILPEQHLSKAFISRVSSFESSAGFFSVFAVLDKEYEDPDFESTIVSILPHTDVNRMLDPANTGASALVLMKSIEEERGKTYRTINTFEPSFFEHVETWKDTKTGHRPQSYGDYKKEKVDRIISRIVNTFPKYKDRINVVDSASVLTFRDYLNSPDGSAYGVKQKISQFNLLGKLPLRNLHAAGQSSVLPGIIGAMMSSFIVGRTILEKEKYNNFLNRNLCN
jgi:phytoene dehydrogenase-like protein